MPRLLCLLMLLPTYLCLHANTVAPDSADYRQLRDVEVVGTATPSPSRSATPLRSINSQSIQQLGLHELSDAVKRFAGATVQDYGGIGGLKTVSVRSLGAKHTAISYDGIPVGDAQSGQVDISRYSLDNVENVSLSIGSPDDIFQPARNFAFGGTLAIVSRRPQFSGKRHNICADIKTGSFGLFNPRLRYEAALGNRWSLSADADWMRADGAYPFTIENGQLQEHRKRSNSDIDTERAELNLYGRTRTSDDLAVKLYFFNSSRGLPGSVVFYNTYAAERLYDKNAFAQASYRLNASRHIAFKFFGKYNYAYTKYIDINEKYYGGKITDRHKQHEYYASACALYTPVEPFALALNSDFAVNTLRNNLPECPMPTRYTSQSVLSAKYSGRRLNATASLTATFIDEHVQLGVGAESRHRLSPAISLSWLVPGCRGLRLRASFQDAFRMPTFNDMYYMRIGNVNLKPEYASQFNAGATWSGSPGSVLSHLSISADGYHNRVRDKIVAIPTLYIWKMMNMGRTSISGADISASAELTCLPQLQLNIDTAYSYQYAIDTTDPDSKSYHNQLPYTPRHSGNASLAAITPWVTVAYITTFAGTRFAGAQNTAANRIDAYTEHSITANHTFIIRECSLRVQAELNNLTGNNYEIIKYYPMPGRSWRLGLTFNF